jgi:opacity protein-like surface antigen
MPGPTHASRLQKGLQVTIAATGSLAATWVAVPVMAQAQPMVVPGANPWTGWNVNVAGGYRQFSTPTMISAGDYSTDGGGGFLQVGVGRDLQRGNAIFGLHGDVQFGHTDARFGCFDSGECYGDAINWGHGASVTGRAGLLIRPDTQAYGLFGWSWQNYAATMFRNGSTATTQGWVNGPTVGVGVETFLAGNRNMTLTGEYRATQLGRIAGSEAKGFSFGGTTEQSVTVGLSFKLGNNPRFFP